MVVEREITFPGGGGHDPEIGADAAGNVYVLYRNGRVVRLATILAGAAAATFERVTTISTEGASRGVDTHDLAVAPDGTIDVVVYDYGSRGYLTHYRRAAGGSSFTSAFLTHDVGTGGAASIARAPDGDLYVASVRASPLSPNGYDLSRWDASADSWVGPSTLYWPSPGSVSELHGRSDGFFLHWYSPAGAGAVADYDRTPTRLDVLETLSAPNGRDSASAMTGAGLLYTYEDAELELSDGSLRETVTAPGITLNTEVDMCADADDRPVLVYYRSGEVVLAIRMPHGGYTRERFFDWRFGVTGATRVTLDAERLPSGNVAFVGGDYRDVGSIVYFEIAY